MDYDPTNYLPEIKAAQTIPDPSVSYAMKLIERVSQLETALKETGEELKDYYIKLDSTKRELAQAREEIEHKDTVIDKLEGRVGLLRVEVSEVIKERDALRARSNSYLRL